MNWVFKTEDRLLINSLENRESKVTFTIYQRNNFKGQAGDKVIFLVRMSEWFFAYHGSISNIEVDKIENETDRKRKFFVLVTDIKELRKDNLLEDYGYSLLKTHKWFDNPIWHFRGQYGRLLKEDYESIIDARIFISRTAFGKIVNSLHKEHRLGFIRYLIDESPDLYQAVDDYVKLFALLKEYVETYIYPDIKLMNEIGTYMLTLNSSEANNLYLAKSADSKEEQFNIMLQANACTEFIKNENYLEYLNTLSEQIKEVFSTELRQSRLFHNIAIPIILN